MNKRIAIWLPGGVGGGLYSQGQPSVSQVVNQLSNDFQVTVFSFHTVNPNFTAKNFQIVTSTRFKGIFRWLLLVLQFLKLHFADKRNRYECLYAIWGFPSGLLVVVLGKILRIPTVIHLQGGEVAAIPEINYGVLLKPIYRVLSIWTYRKVDHLIALTEYQRKLINQAGVNRLVRVIPYGVDMSQFTHRNLVLNNNELRCLHVANLTPVKDQETLLKAFALISVKRPALLHIVGLDTFNGELNKLCGQLGIQHLVTFFSSQPHQQIQDFYDWADVFILTSIYEGQGVVLVEAAASCVLLAGTNVGLLNDLGSDYGVVVQPRDFHGLAHQILKTIDDTETAISKITKSYEWAKEHSIDWTVQEIIKVINS